ncbi:MAG: LysR family transcriptional regulator [Parvibaculaceae bacterium]
MANQENLSLTLKQLRYVVASADHRNITAAALALHVSQPSLSMAIAAVEAQYGRKLFARQQGQGVAPTAFGRSFVAEARAILAQAQALQRLGRADGPLSGELTLGCFTDLAPYYVPDLIKRFAAKEPGIGVSLREGGFDDLGERLESGVLDLALTYDLGLSSRFERHSLVELRPYAMLAADHPLARGKAVSLKQLAAHPLVLTEQALSWQHVLELFAHAGVALKVSMRASSFELQRSMVASGLGVAVAYTRPRHDQSYDGRRLVARPISDRLPLQRILLAWAKANRPSPAAARFAAFVREQFTLQGLRSTAAR